MKKFALIAGFLTLFLSAPASTHAYYRYLSVDSYHDPIRMGEHSYDIRREEREYMQRVREYERRLRRSVPIEFDYIYAHPARADRRELHPFYRQDGRSYLEHSFSDIVNWRGQLPRHSVRSQSPSPYCSNFTGSRPYNRFTPTGYQCW